MTRTFLLLVLFGIDFHKSKYFMPISKVVPFISSIWRYFMRMNLGKIGYGHLIC